MNAIAVTAQPLDMEGIVGLVSTSGGLGAIASFVGVVRNENQNRAVTHLEYEAYEPLAVKALKQIRHEAAAQWPGVQLAVHYRTCRLEIGEASIVIAAASAYRADAFAVCRYVIECVKQI